jgi:copper chaperone CopZ
MKNHRYLYCSFLLIISLAAKAQTHLKGQVKDNKGTTIENAKVYLMTKTDASGIYAIEQNTEKKTAADGSFDLIYTGKDPLLTVEAAGFERKKVKITEGGVEIVLQPTAPTENNNNGLKNGIITVNGVCGMCKKRIEMATYAVAGVKSAVWSAEKQALTVSFDASKTDLDAIKKKVASIGHDAPPFAAEKKVYDKLPSCCRYKDGISLH